MTKLIHLLQTAGTTTAAARLETVLLDPALRDRLALAGVERLQVNLDDGPVAAAMRIPTLDPPVVAVVTTWAGAGLDDAEVTRTLVEAIASAGAVDVAGYRVEEHLPIPPPPAADGVREDALANVALLRRPAELDRETWLHRWLVDHTPVAIATQATSGYVQNVVVEALTPGAPVVDAVVEELSAPTAVTDVHAFYGSGGDDDELGRRMTAMMTSIARFGADRDLDLVPTGRWTWTL